MLRTLDDTVEGKYRTLVSTNLEAMRGIDYRSPTNGIILLICKSFCHKREANQAGYRVGRQTDPCQRLILKDLNILDNQQVLLYKARLYEFIKMTAPRPVIKFARPVIKLGKLSKKKLAEIQTQQQGVHNLFNPINSKLGGKRVIALLGKQQ